MQKMGQKIMPKILDGRAISSKIAEQLTQQILVCKTKPTLVIIQIGNNEESNTYIKHKRIFAEKIGAIVKYVHYDEDVSEESVVVDIETYNTDTSIHGIIVQLPIPKNLSESRILESIDPRKDIDGLTSASAMHLFNSEKGFVSCATKAVLVLLDNEQIDVTGKKVVIVGHSALVGKPTALALINRNATVTVCHAFTKNLDEETKRADILITAVGKPKLITKNFVSPGQIVIDIGITVLSVEEDGVKKKKVVGDVDYEAVKDIVAAITPVPGGIGPLTIACLFESLLEVYENLGRL
jgi:methylenetetrahydrofolate dehydrogenase (NADP+)/methenyltetrahydrofolate cyclohydrolase